MAELQTCRSAVVTGAASGIGLAAAEMLAARGHRVRLVDRDPAVEAVAARMRDAGHRVESLVVDLEPPDAVVELGRRVLAMPGGCDILVNNAGINPKREGRGYQLEEIDLAVWQRVMAVNLTTPFLLCRELMPTMRERGWGRVINIASRAGRCFIPGVSAFYSAGKGGLIALTRQLAGEYAGGGVTVNCVAPGPVETPLSAQSSTETKALAAANIPVGRRGEASDIAAAIDYLASEQAGYICGTCIDVNGGGYMN